MQTWCLLLFATLSTLVVPVGPAAAQDAPPRQSTDATDPQGVLVQGVVLDPGTPLPQRLRGVDPIRASELADHSETFVRCMGEINRDLLGKVIDGPPNEASTRFALDRLIRTNAACYSSLPYSTAAEPPAYGNCNPASVGTAVGNSATSTEMFDIKIPPRALCRAMFDRGALFIHVLDEYAPNLRLTRAQTSNPVVQQRWDARESERNRFRHGGDEKLAFVAACMVQLSPELAMTLLHADPDARDGATLQALIVDRGRACVGGRSQVMIDPLVFKTYVAEAVYRWLVASSGRETLLPPDADG